MLHHKKLVNLFFEMSKDCHTLIECGARGAEASVRFGRTAIAIEANPETFNQKTAHAPHIQRMNVALDKQEGFASFHFFDKSSMPGNASLFERNDKKTQRKITVPVTTLDKVSENLGDGIALWIDVEGKAYEVLEGGIETLKKTKVLIVEVEQIPFWCNQKLDIHVKEFLENHGFVFVNQDQEYPQQYNMLYVNSNNFPPPKS